jgi:hypothetical protein
MALGLRLCAGVVKPLNVQEGSKIIVTSHTPEESPMRNTMRKWGEELLLAVALIAIAVLVVTL